jgi:hypothetical protein
VTTRLFRALAAAIVAAAGAWSTAIFVTAQVVNAPAP